MRKQGLATRLKSSTIFLQTGRTGAQRKLSLTEKLSASPESLLIDRHIDETYLQNLQNFSFGRFELGLLATLAFVTGVTQRDIYITFVTVTSLLGYICGLPKLFLVFKKSFSFGEGCLVLQVILLYTAHSFIHLHNDNNSSQLLLEVDSNGDANCNVHRNKGRKSGLGGSELYSRSKDHGFDSQFYF